MHFRISRTMNAEDIFRCSIGCEIMLMIKARIRLIFSRYTCIISVTVTFDILILEIKFLFIKKYSKNTQIQVNILFQ